MTQGAMRPSHLRPATKVCVPQWPKGALPFSRSPFNERPRNRVNFVVVPVSSMKISRWRSRRMMGWRPSLYSALALASSGLSCSLARRVFFKAEPASNEELRKPGRIHLDAPGPLQRLGQFRHGDVAAGRDCSKDEVLVGAELAMPEAAARARLDTARRAPELHQVHRKRNRCPEVGGRLVARMPGLHKRHNTLTQIVRQRMRHGKSPPQTLNHISTDLRIPIRFKLTARCSELRKERRDYQRFQNGSFCFCR